MSNLRLRMFQADVSARSVATESGISYFKVLRYIWGDYVLMQPFHSVIDAAAERLIAAKVAEQEKAEQAAK